MAQPDRDKLEILPMQEVGADGAEPGAFDPVDIEMGRRPIWITSWEGNMSTLQKGKLANEGRIPDSGRKAICPRFDLEKSKAWMDWLQTWQSPPA